MGFDHVSHSQAVVLLLSLISASHAGLLGAGHLIFMMMVVMMKTNMKRTTMKMLNYEQHKCSGHGAGSCLANNNDNNDDNDGNDNDK